MTLSTIINMQFSYFDVKQLNVRKAVIKTWKYLIYFRLFRQEA